MALSCVGTEGLDEIPNGEICMSPVLSDMTKTRAGGATNPYPDGSSFGVFAYYSTATGGQKWSDEGESYFHNHQFKKQDGVCAGVDPVYWPLSGSLIFAGYSPYEAGANTAFDPATKTLTINDYTVDGTKDLMYFLPELSDGNYVGYDKSTASVPVKFHHALSCVSINVAAKSGDEANIKLKRITLKNVYTQGQFTANASTPAAGTWEDKASVEDKDLHINDEGSNLSPSLDFQYFIIPGDASEIEIVYLDRGVEKSHSITPADHIAFWDQGLRYQYNITLSVGLDPVVIDKSKVSVSIEHIYQSGITLAGSRVNLNLDLVNLGLTSEQLARIKNFTVSVKKNGVTYKQKTFDSISNSLSITEGDKFYLPYQLGTFDVVCTYNDGIEDRSLTLTASAPAPEYDLYLDFIAGSDGVTMYSASVNISENVLGEVNLSSSDQYNSSMVRFAGQTTARFATGDCDLDSPQFLKDARKSGKPYTNGYYAFYNTVLFDGIDPENTHYSLFNKIETWTTPYRVHSIKLNKIQYAQEHMQDGDMYVICATQNTQRYWYVDGNGNLKLSTSAPDHSNIAKEYIFRYDYVDQNVVQENGYNQYSSVGTWYSCYTGKYMNKDTDPVFNQPDPSLYVKCATGWGDDKRDGPVDMMKGYKQLLRYGSSVDKAYWSGTEAPDQYWKWDLYEVVIE